MYTVEGNNRRKLRCTALRKCHKELKITQFKTSPKLSRHLRGLAAVIRITQLRVDMQTGRESWGKQSTFDIRGSNLDRLARERLFLIIVRNMEYSGSLL